jgi:tetratricopeptide (TPR) repeat protein
VLGVRRHEDVPSWLIPSIYLDFVRTRDARRLRPVFEHNRYDILTMVALGSYAARMLAQPLELRPGQPRQGAEIAAVARLHERRGEEACSARLYAAALRQQLPGDLRVKTLWRLGLVCKRQRAWPAAAKVWHRIVDEEPALRLPALIELAKLYEHRRPDLARARALATQAYRLWQQAPDGPGVRLLASVESGQRTLGAALLHRLSRLERRLARAVPPGRPPEATGYD